MMFESETKKMEQRFIPEIKPNIIGAKLEN